MWMAAIISRPNKLKVVLLPRMALGYLHVLATINVKISAGDKAILFIS